ncbi:2OG-FeII oxygenase superfamily protein [Klosneuvirus KNV1]|uniref:2OG-FeII oxygenase superfamily protein n=1 Tax=Klosneuvirus KNV1 TaxID=1977640 RepID=A0A1V0SLG0_9VIRU|nr:2OG-FeII oxygenase superfamily protein [Klosneuvirus KNV1]
MSWGKLSPYGGRFKYTEPEKKQDKPQNQASKYASQMLKSERAMVDGKLTNDYQLVLKNGCTTSLRNQDKCCNIYLGCTYLPNFFCQTKDLNIFNQLKKELDEHKDTGMINWSKHFRHEDPSFSKTFNDIVEQMAKHFNVEVLQTRLNYYKDGNDWKPYHHDKHAYGDGADKIREDFTMGASFGASRNLDFRHVGSNLSFTFPQNNGDIFAFNSDINKAFMHGIPKANQNVGERFSIIAWGKKKE